MKRDLVAFGQAAAPQTTKPAAWRRRSAECVRQSVVGPEAYGFARCRSAVRTSSSCAAPPGTNAACGADTKVGRAFRRNTKRLRVFSRPVSLRKRTTGSMVESPHRFCRLTRSHGGTESLLDIMCGDVLTASLRFLSVAPCLRVRHPMSTKETHVFTKHRGGGVSLFVSRRTGVVLSCRTAGARSCRHSRENPKGVGARAAVGDAAGIRPDDVRVASIARRAISRRCRFVFARSATVQKSLSPKTLCGLCGSA